MANGFLGKSLSSAGNLVPVYTVPANADFATISINCCNLGTADATLRIAITTSPNPAPQDYIEYGGVVPANGGIIERTCMTVSANESIVVYADTNDVAIRIHGLEQLN